MNVRNRAHLLLLRLSKLSDENKKIARGMALVAAFALAAKFVAASKEVAIAWRYGVSELVDAYLFVFNLLTLPVTIWYGILTVVFVPLAARVRMQGAEGLSLFRAELLGMAILIGISVGVLALGVLTAYFSFPVSGLSNEVQRLALSIVPWMSVLIPLGVVTHWGSVQMISDGRHGNTILEGIPALALLLTVILVSSSTMTPLVVGTLVGAICHMFAAVTMASKGRWFERPRFSMQSPAWRFFWGSMGIMLLGQILQNLINIIDQFYAAYLEPGAIARLSYAHRILSLVLTLGATAVARAALPVLSNMYARRESTTNAIAIKWAVLMFGAGLGALVIGWPAAQWIIRTLFERGAFTSSDTVTVAEILQYGFTQLPFNFAALVLVYALLSRERYKAVALIGAINLATKVLFAAWLVPAMGLNGLMLATTAMCFVSCLVAWRLLRA